MKRNTLRKSRKYSAMSTLLTVLFAIISIIWVMPVVEVVINSLKDNAYVNLELCGPGQLYQGSDLR